MLASTVRWRDNVGGLGKAMRMKLTNTNNDLMRRLASRAAHVHRIVSSKIPRPLRATLDAEDILQEVWTAAFRHPDRVPITPGELDTWLVAVALRRVATAIESAQRKRRGGSAVRQQRAKDERTSMIDLLATLAAHGRTPSSEDAAREAVLVLQLAMCRLPGQYREALTLHHIEGQTRREVAERMQTSQAAVHGLLFRGLQLLRETLGPAGKFFSGEAVPPARQEATT